MDYTKICINCMHMKNDPYEVCPNCGFDPAGYRWSPYALAPFTVLYGRYLVGKVLGTGGFGITYMVFDMVLERTRAVKEMFVNGSMYRDSEKTPEVTIVNNGSDSLQIFEANLDRFVQEARILAKLEELPGIVRVYDCFQENGTAYIVMEYLEGTTLKQYQQEKGGKLSYGEALEKFRPVIGSLEHLHKNGIIHRDISPDNLMVRKDGTLTLFDFGGAGIKGEELRSFTAIKNGFTPVEQQYAEGSQGAWTDEYAMAATIYYSITGIIPPESVERAIRIKDDPLQKPASLVTDLPKDVEDALLKGLSVQKEDRFPDMEAFEKALYNADSGVGKKDVEDSKGGDNKDRDPKGGDIKNGDSKGGDKKTGDSNDGGNNAGDLNGGGGNKHRIPIIAAIASLAVIVVVLLALNQRGTFKDGGGQKPANESEQLQASTGGAGVVRSGDKVADDSKKNSEESEAVSPTSTSTPKPTATDTPTPKPTATNTPTPEPTATKTPTPKPTTTNMPTPRPTATNTPTPKPTATNTPTPKPTATNTPTPKPTATNTPTPKPTATNTPTPMPNPFDIRVDNLKDAVVGNEVEFGHYPQSESGEEKPIKWYVLSKKDHLLMLVSKYALDNIDPGYGTNWSNSYLRSWLNGTFYNDAFSDEEKAIIPLSTVDNSAAYWDEDPLQTCEDTEDKVFIMSHEEEKEYLFSYLDIEDYGESQIDPDAYLSFWESSIDPNEFFYPTPTDYALKKGAYIHESGAVARWVRAFAPNGGYYAAYAGELDEGWDLTSAVVRPVIWVYSGKDYFYKPNMIKTVQENLNKASYNCGQADGILGDMTKKAIKEYQKDQGIEVTGIVTFELYNSLREYVN